MNSKISTVYCVSPTCEEPKNASDAINCQSCGSKLLLNDRYQVLGILGKGGFGATFAAIDVVLPGRPICVVKQLRPASSDPQVYKMAKELFIREAQTLGKVGGHPQVPRLLDYFEETQQFYLVQEFVKGNNLHQEVKKRGPFSEPAVKQFLTEILPILDYIHSQKVIHRDIKPANIIRREQDKQLVLIDFGAVKNQVNSVVAGSNPNSALTQFAIGTAGFAPPEQLAMRPVYCSDIYALGITCVYLLTGKSPKDLESDPTTGELVWTKNLDLNEAFVKVLKTMLEVSVKQRYKTAKDVLLAMDALPYQESLAEGMLTTNMGGNKTVGRPGKGPVTSAQVSSHITQTSTQGSRFGRGNTSIQPPTSSVANDNGKTTGGQNAVDSSVTIGGRPSKLDSESILRLYEDDKKDFAQHQLASLILSGANLPGIRFSEANLTQSNFQESNLSNANFEKAKLTRAVFKQAVLQGAQMNQTDLEEADLRGADLRSANLRSANLKGANFCGANLQNAQVRKEQLVHAKTNWTTIMPSGKRGFW